MGIYFFKILSKVTKAVEQGVNVLIWSWNFDLGGEKRVRRESSSESLSLGLNIDNYKLYKQYLISMGYDSSKLKHLVKIGGWNSRDRFPSGYSGSQLYDAFRKVNVQNKSDGGEYDHEYEFDLLWDGINFDYEGYDQINHPNNEYTKEFLDQMGDFSSDAKKDGLIVSLAPPESYLDTTTCRFSRFVNLTYPNDTWHQDFQYHGRNLYAYLMAKFGTNVDFVFIQFYESYSHALYQTEIMNMRQSDFLIQYMKHLADNEFGYVVNFGSDDPTVELKDQFVHMPSSKVVFGFSNGWAIDSEKNIYFTPSEVQRAYDHMYNTDLAPRGFGYWVIEEEGENGVYLAAELNYILHKNESLNWTQEQYILKSST